MTVEGVSARTVVLVEGVSDRLAIEALARRRGCDLAGAGIVVVPIGGSRNATRFLERYGPSGLGLRVAGMYDAAQEGDYRRGLERTGLGAGPTRAAMAQLGFHVCVADLEDELIRALGVAAVERVLEAEGEIDSFRIFQRQPQWRDRGEDEQLRRFLGTYRGRKIRCAPLLVDALDLSRVPRPLDGVLASVMSNT